MIITCLALAALTGAAIAFRAAAWGGLWLGTVASAVLGAALSGAVALVWQAAKGSGAPRLTAAGLGLAAIVVAFVTGVALRGPAQRIGMEAGLREMERQVPFFAALRETDPEVHARTLDRIREVLGERGGLDDVANRVRPLISAAVAARTPYMEDALLARVLALSVVQGRELLPSRPDLCAALFTGGATGALAPHLSEATRREELALLEDMLRTPRPSPPPAAASEMQIADALGRVGRDVAGTLGIAPERLGQWLQGSGAPAEVCRAQLGVMEALAALAPGVGLPVFRRLLLAELGNRPI